MPRNTPLLSPLSLIALCGVSLLIRWNVLVFPTENDASGIQNNKEKIHLAKNYSTVNHTTIISPVNLINTDDNHEFETMIQLQIFRQYQNWHSHETLEREFANDEKNVYQERKFVLAYYSCPYQAGNRLHHFMNAMIWAIVTNRTLLYKYYDKGTCKQVGQKHDGRICSFTNTEAECDRVLHRATWIPSFDYWSKHLNLSSPTRLDYWATHVPPSVTSARIFKKYPLPATNNNSSIDALSDRLIELGQLLGLDSTILSTKENRELLLKTSDARERARQLFHDSKLLVYGMLFRQCFVIDDLLQPPKDQKETTKTVSPSIALHSRHSSDRDLGDHIDREIVCLQAIWNELNISSNVPCKIHVMSDRSRTLRELNAYLREHTHCTMHVALHEQATYSFSGEHGPFAGAGYFRDMANCIQARNGFIGSSRRSSSNLIEEILEYDAAVRGQEYQLKKCYLDRVS